ncbi:MAG: cytochrome c peroxidase [Polyangiaceae bacterium]
MHVARSWTAMLLSSLLFGCSGAGDGGEGGGGGAPGGAWPVDPDTGLRVADLGPVPPLPEWPDNPATAEKKLLGATLFTDPRLSGSGKTVCGNCHFPLGDYQSGGPKDAPDRSFPDIDPTLPRNTPSLLNLVYAKVYRWDGSHASDLVDQMVLPFAEANMNLTPGIPKEEVSVVDVPLAQATLKDKLTVEIPGYVPLFQSAFGEDISALSAEETWRLAGKALAVYVRVAVSRDSAFDKWNAGDDDAMSPAAIRGFELFRGKAACVNCHSGPLFTDFQFHNIGTSPPGPDGARPDEGRYLVTGDDADRGAFLTPTLRSAASTSPYLHDGSEGSIANVLRRKTSPEALSKDPNHDLLLDGLPELSEAEIDDLIELIKALRGADIPLEELELAPELP